MPSGAPRSSILLLATFLSPALPAKAAPTVALFGNFHAMGVTVDYLPTDDPEGNATAAVEYKESGPNAYRPAFPPARVLPTRIAGSLFWLTPGTGYDVRVTISDPDGPPMNGQVLTLSGATRPEVTLPPAARSYHASPGGGGTTCDLAQPCALAQAVGSARAGEEVVLHGGVYYAGGISLTRSGAPGAPIVVRGASGESAILDGSDPQTFTWTATGGGVYHTTINAPDPNLVLSDGQRLYPYRALADLQNLIWGLPGFYASGVDLYARLAGDVDPGTTTMVVSRFVSAFQVSQNFIYFSDLTFRHYGLNPFPKAIYLNGASDCLVQRSTFTLNDIGIGIKRASWRNLIQDNGFSDTTFNWPWDAVKAGAQLEGGGIVFYSPTGGSGNVIRRNVFHDLFDGFGSCPQDNGGVSNETDVYENLVYNAGDDGLSADGACTNLRVWRNTFHDVLVGISLAPVTGGPVYAIRNLIYKTGAGNNSYTGNCFKFNNGFGIPSGPCYLLHTTCDAVKPQTAATSFFNPGEADLVVARNNIWSGTDLAVYNVNPAYTIDFDLDDLWVPAGNLVRWLGTPYPALADFQAGTGQEPRGMSLDPGFNAASSGDYTLAPSSAIIDRGGRLPGIDDDFNGAAPDVGAFESGTVVTSCDLMSDDVTFPPVVPAKTGSWVYTRTCAVGGDRLSNVNFQAPASGTDLRDPPGGLPGTMRLYQVDCPCTSRLGLVKNAASGFVRLVYF